MPKPKPKKRAAGRKGGAQPGNKNAEKHGFYSASFSAEESKRIADTDGTSIQSEIDLLRVCMDRLLQELDMLENTHTDTQGNTTRDSHYLAQLNTLAIMSQSLSTLIRTQHLTKGKGGAVEQGILEALAELRLEMGL
jgi:hypothetical protein